MADGIIPFTQYFPQESLSQARLRGEQLRSAQSARGMQEAKQSGLMAAYGAETPEDLYRMKAEAEMAQQKQAAFGQDLDRFGKVMDLIEEDYDNYGQEAVDMVLANPNISGVVSQFIDPAKLKVARDRAGTKRFSGVVPNVPFPGVDEQGQPMQLEPGKSYEKVTLPDGQTYFREEVMTKEVAQKGAQKPADLNKMVKRISDIQAAKVRLQRGDTDAMALVGAALGIPQPEVDKMDIKAAVAALDNEKRILEGQLPEGYQMPEQVDTGAIQEVTDAVGAFLGKYGPK
jgi:hypothetical protein